jgi:flagellar protein FliO/FliZ
VKKNYILLIFFCSPLYALEQAAPAVADPFSASYLFKLVAVMGFILLLIFALAWMMKKMQITQNSQNGVINIVSAISVGQRDRIALIQVGEEQILVGLTPGKIEKLHELKQPVAMPQVNPAAQNFSDKFQQLMKRSKNHAHD